MFQIDGKQTNSCNSAVCCSVLSAELVYYSQRPMNGMTYEILTVNNISLISELCRFCTESLVSNSSFDGYANEIRFVCKTFAGLCGTNQYAWRLVPPGFQLVFCFANWM